MYPPPQEVPSEVFASVPEDYRNPVRTEWADTNRGGQHLPSFLEGPSFDRAGNLYVVDIPHGRIFRVAPDGAWTLVTQYDGWPNGLKLHRDGSIYIADYKWGIMRLDPASGGVTPHLTRRRLEPFKGCNDLVFADNGDLYFTDQGQTGLHDPSGRVFRITADGRLELVLDGIPSPNGLVLSPDERTLYVAVTRDNAVWRVPFVADGGVSKVGRYLQLSGGSGPDGMAICEDGSLVVAHVGLGSVWVFSPVGEPLYRVRSCTGSAVVTNVAFGGPERRTLYITDSGAGAILRAELPVTGRAMYSHH